MGGKKVWKRIVVIIMILGMLTGILAGCSGKSEKEENDQEVNKRAKGRYIEKEIALPEDSGKPVDVIYQDSKLVLYTYSSGEECYQSYIYENEQWSEPQRENWLTEAKDQLEQEIVDIFAGRDGNLYARTESAAGTHLLKAGNSGESEDVTPLDVSDNNTAGFIDAAVLKDGTIGIGDHVNTMVRFYKEGKLTCSIEGIRANSEEQTMLEVNDQTAAIVGKDGTSIEFYDTAVFSKKNTVTLEQQFGDGFLIPGANRIWYFVNTKGIYRILEDGSISEMIMDGRNGLMSNDTMWFLRKFILGGGEEFYGLYSNAKQEWKFMQYLFDKEAAAVQEQTLSVYSLRENRTVDQAVYEFKSRHPEVRIEYFTAVTGEEQPTVDHILTLNTELLSGSGADVLILDDLPMESYIEKGVLSDLTETAEKLKKAGVLKNIIEDTAQKDGKIYAVPARVNVPVIFGTEEEIKACESMKSVKTYAQNNVDKNLFGITSHDLIGMTLFHMFYDELEEKNGRINEERLSELLTAWMQICENGNFKKYEEKYFETEASLWQLLDMSFCSSQDVLGQNEYANVIELTGLNSLQAPYTSAEKTGTSPQNFKGYYVPKTIAGVNASSKQTKLAGEFVECLFSENVQQMDNWDGLPVLSSVLETYPDYVESEEGQERSMGYIGINFETEAEFEETLTYPTKKEMERLMMMMKELKSPFIQDRIITDTVQQELELCYKGKQSPEETAEAICRKIDRYLSE